MLDERIGQDRILQILILAGTMLWFLTKVIEFAEALWP